MCPSTAEHARASQGIYAQQSTQDDIMPHLQHQVHSFVSPCCLATIALFKALLPPSVVALKRTGKEAKSWVCGFLKRLLRGHVLEPRINAIL